jgi:hypothetical protein
VANIIAKYGILDEDVYNFDETGFLMGIIILGMVVTSLDGRADVKKKQLGNREWVTVIQGVGALGFCIPLFIVVAGKVYLSSWYEESPLLHDWVIATTENS